MESVVYVGSIIFASLWTVGWLLFRKYSLGHAVQIYPCVAMWMAIRAVHNEDLPSAYHLLWLMPACLVVGSIVGVYLTKFFMVLSELGERWDKWMTKISYGEGCMTVLAAVVSFSVIAATVVVLAVAGL